MNRIEAVMAGMKMIRELTLEESHAEIERLRTHVADLQSGMWINCVYCGHRYGPRDATAPAIPGATPTMAEALATHIAACPLHPLKAALDRVAELEEMTLLRNIMRGIRRNRDLEDLLAEVLALLDADDEGSMCEVAEGCSAGDPADWCINQLTDDGDYHDPSKPACWEHRRREMVTRLKADVAATAELIAAQKAAEAAGMPTP